MALMRQNLQKNYHLPQQKTGDDDGGGEKQMWTVEQPQERKKKKKEIRIRTHRSDGSCGREESKRESRRTLRPHGTM